MSNLQESTPICHACAFWEESRLLHTTPEACRFHLESLEILIFCRRQGATKSTTFSVRIRTILQQKIHHLEPAVVRC